MPIINAKQTQKEFGNYFKEVLNSLVRKTFSKDERLIFVTYQPSKLTLQADIVSEHTNRLFSAFEYVEVIEQTFKVNKRYNYGSYIDGFHSHIIMRESDYNALKCLGKGIVAKYVYYLDGLQKYLSKQAGNTDHRILPTKRTPLEIQLTDVEATEPNDVLAVTASTKPKLHFIFKNISVKRFKNINKIARFSMFVDDT